MPQYIGVNSQGKWMSLPRRKACIVEELEERLGPSCKEFKRKSQKLGEERVSGRK